MQISKHEKKWLNYSPFICVSAIVHWHGRPSNERVLVTLSVKRHMSIIQIMPTQNEYKQELNTQHTLLMERNMNFMIYTYSNFQFIWIFYGLRCLHNLKKNSANFKNCLIYYPEKTTGIFLSLPHILSNSLESRERV